MQNDGGFSPDGRVFREETGAKYTNLPGAMLLFFMYVFSVRDLSRGG